MSDEWESEQLDLAAYQARIGYHGPLEATGRNLAGLHRAHVAAIPFENLDVVLGRGIAVDLASVQDKLVARRRGGYCYEHGLLFAVVLERLGYRVDRLLARVGNDTDKPRPRTHLTLRVRTDTDTDTGAWLADVGFGAGLLAPLPWANTSPHRQGGWTYQLHSPRPGSWQLRQRHGEDWHVLYSFTAEPQHAVDIAMANHFTATHPTSPFVGQLVVMRKNPDRHRQLLDRRLTRTRPDGTTDGQQLTDPELLSSLRDQFGLALTRDEARELLAALPAEPKK